MGYKAVVFDWDGTLANSISNIVQCVQNACQELKIECPPSEDLKWSIGLSLESMWYRFFSEYPKEMYPSFRSTYLKYNLLVQQEIVLFDGVLEMLQSLKSKGVLLAVATGKGYSGLEKALKTVDLLNFFDTVRTADRTASKPDPLMLEEILWELDLKPQEIVMVGDTSHDLQLALNAGVDGVGVNYGGAHGVDNLQKIPSKYIAHSVSELQSWLLQHIK